jgi:hypothetical protein
MMHVLSFTAPNRMQQKIPTVSLIVLSEDTERCTQQSQLRSARVLEFRTNRSGTKSTYGSSRHEPLLADIGLRTLPTFLSIIAHPSSSAAEPLSLSGAVEQSSLLP